MISLYVLNLSHCLLFNAQNQYEEQSRYISDLKAAYQQASLEMERRMTSQQRDYQQKISTLLRQFNEDSSGKDIFIVIFQL